MAKGLSFSETTVADVSGGVKTARSGGSRRPLPQTKPPNIVVGPSPKKTSKVHTFSILTSRPQEVSDALRHWSGKGAGGVLFLSGGLVKHAEHFAENLSRYTPNPWLIAAGAGVLTEAGELERESAAVALTLRNAPVHLVHRRANPEFSAALLAQLQAHPGSSALLLLRSDQDDGGWLSPLSRPSSGHPLLGGGTLPGISLYATREGRVQSGGASATIIGRSAVARVRSSSACRLLSPLRSVTLVRGPMVHEIEGAPALDRLKDATDQLTEQALVLLAVTTADAPLAPSGRQVALRAIQGVDPTRGSLMTGEDLPQGAKVAFAVRDAYGSRTDLEAQLRSLQKSCAGSAPEFGIYLCGAGRGQGLYGTSNVDVRLIRRIFPEMPLVGLHSTFELAPLDGHIVQQIYSGVLGVFCRPS